MIPSFFQPVAVDIIAKLDVIAGAIAGSGQNGLLIGRTDVVFERILTIFEKVCFRPILERLKRDRPPAAVRDDTDPLSPTPLFFCACSLTHHDST